MTPMRRPFSLVALLLLATIAAAKPSLPPQGAAAPSLPPQGAAALSAVLKSATDRGDIPGVVVTVVSRQGVLYDEAFGVSSMAAKTPMTTDAIFNLASMTKPITSAAVMLLVDQGRLSLDDDVAKYLPKYKDPMVLRTFNEADGMYVARPAKRPITIRHLLTHTSGMAYGFSNPMMAKLAKKTGKGELDLPLLFDPGEGWAYGPSTRVLGSVIETISGQKLDAFLAFYSLRSFRMLDTSYLVPPKYAMWVAAINMRGPDGVLAERPRPATFAANIAGDGGLYGTAADYGQFLRMLLNHGKVGGVSVLSEKSVKAMLEPQTDVIVRLQQSTDPTISKDFPTGAGKDRWGLGFQLAAERVPNRRSPGSGSWAGIFNTHFFIDPAAGIGVVVMMQVLPFYDDAAMKLYDAVEDAIYRNLK